MKAKPRVVETGRGGVEGGGTVGCTLGPFPMR